MTDLVIRSGGVVEVDTESLRDTAVRLRGIAGEADEIGGSLRSVGERLLLVGGSPPAAELARARAALAEVEDRAGELAGALAEAAVLYEAVELLAQRAAAQSAGDAPTVAVLDDDLARVVDGHPDVYIHAQQLLEAEPDRDELARQAWMASLGLSPFGGFLPLGAAILGAGIDLLGRGAVPAGQRLGGGGEPVAVRPVASAATTAPATLAAAAARIPGGSDARVRVERYALPGGQRQFAVYIAGTQAVAGTEPFDLRSNVQLYGGQRSASYDAVVNALHRAGARPGDVVHAFGHSQGAMIGERLALEGTYDVRTLVSFGSPVQGDVGDQTLAVTVRHSDDPIAALQGDGHPTGVGAPGSFVVERTADPQAGLHDAAVPAHQMSAYEQAAALIDSSADPRVARLREALAGLAIADAVVAIDHAAERISPASSAAGSPPGSR